MDDVLLNCFLHGFDSAIVVSCINLNAGILDSFAYMNLSVEVYASLADGSADNVEVDGLSFVGVKAFASDYFAHMEDDNSIEEVVASDSNMYCVTLNSLEHLSRD